MRILGFKILKGHHPISQLFDDCVVVVRYLGGRDEMVCLKNHRPQENLQVIDASQNSGVTVFSFLRDLGGWLGAYEEPTHMLPVKGNG